MVRFLRTLSETFQELLGPQGPWHRLLKLDAPVVAADARMLDVQLRANDKLTFYHGTTKLLDLCFDEGSCSLSCSAAPAYHEVPGYSELQKIWTVKAADSLVQSVARYLEAAVNSADDRYFRNGAEGAWQNALSRRFGHDWTPADSWLMVDRESILCYDSDPEKDAIEASVAAEYQSVRHEFQNSDPVQWGQPSTKGLGNKVDHLAIGPSGELLVIELKHGTNASGIYWAPLQAAVYRDCWRAALPTISEGVKELVRQKIALGLLPATAVDRLPQGEFKELRGAVLVAEPNDRSSCWRRAAQVMARCPKADVPFFDVSGIAEPRITSRTLPPA